MKRTKLMMKLSALALAALCAVSLASCNAAPTPEENGGFLENMGGAAGNNPEYSFEDDMDVEMGTGVFPDSAETEGDLDEPNESGTGEGCIETDPIDPQPADLLLNQFINASEQPFSTFSADVDTASYTYFRKLVNAGYGFRDLRNSGSNFRSFGNGKS